MNKTNFKNYNKINKDIYNKITFIKKQKRLMKIF